MGELEHNLISGLLLAVLTFALALTFLFMYLIVRLRKREHALVHQEADSEFNSASRAFGLPRHFPFKRPDCWLAVRNNSLHAVQSALALHHAKPCSWADGLADDSDQKLFISPPVSGWILVMGSALPNPCDDEDASFRFLLGLSRKLGHVQLFSAGEVFHQHAWVRAEMGRVVRAYAWAGRTLWNQGEMTDSERILGLKCYNYAQSPDPSRFGHPDAGLGNSDKVHLLAARWSVDPDDIDDRFIEGALGVVGEPERRLR
jgi:hypothetical protein